MERIYTISEAASFTGINESTLRHWEKEFKDFLSVSRDKNGSRIYTQLDMDKFKSISDMRKKGLSLSAIKHVFQTLHGGGSIDSSLEIAATAEATPSVRSLEVELFKNLSQKFSEQLNVQLREAIREELKILLEDQKKQIGEVLESRLDRYKRKPWWRFW